MTITVRQEIKADYNITEKIVKEAFAPLEFSDKTEHKLVARIRKSTAFIPKLSLVAIDRSIVGHILLSEIEIMDDNQSVSSLALAPISVLPGEQNKGIGKQLIHEALKKAKEIGYQSVIVMGHETYYPKFGFKPASLWGIKAPFEVPDESFLAIELEDGALANISGVVQYPSVFFE